MTNATLQELEEAKEVLIGKYIGEWDKGIWYFRRLEYLEALISDKLKATTDV